jgi:hypothetical protein
MRKLIVVLAVLLAASFTVAMVSCESTGGGKSGGELKPFNVDLSKLTIVPESGNNPNKAAAFKGVRNTAPLERAWRWFVVSFDEGALPANITDYSRVTVTVQCYDEDGNEIEGADSNVQIAMFYNIEGELHADGNRNLIFKEQNVGGYSGLLNKDRGVRVRLSGPPGGLVIQAAQNVPAFVEVTSVTFHTNTASGE